MKKYFVYCDMCKEEVSYHLIPRYQVDDVLRDLLKRRVIDVEHLCEPCMHNLNAALTDAINFWKENKGRIEITQNENTLNELFPSISQLNKLMVKELKSNE